MEKVNTIVVALDLEAGSEAVLGRATGIAIAHAAELVVLHVVEAQPLSQAAALMDLSENELRKRLKRHALGAIESLTIDSGRSRCTEVQVVFGSPLETITRVADERHADFIVIGSGKSRSLREKVLGSTAEGVVRTSRVPVLVVRKRSREAYRRVVVAVDFSAQSLVAVKEARKLAPDARLQLVHAIDIPHSFEQAMVRAGTSQTEIKRYRSAVAAKAREELSACARDVVADRKVAVRILGGEAGPALVRLSRGVGVDLLAMGSHGRGVVLEALLGSATQRVIRQAACDVLVAKAWQ